MGTINGFLFGAILGFGACWLLKPFIQDQLAKMREKNK